jgi:hypothetical protein
MPIWFKSVLGHLSKVGPRFYQSFKLEGAFWMSRIANNEFHVKGSNMRFILVAAPRGVNVGMNRRNLLYPLCATRSGIGEQRDAILVALE